MQLSYKEFKKIVIDYFSNKLPFKKSVIKKILTFKENATDYQVEFIFGSKTLILEYTEIRKENKWYLTPKKDLTIYNWAPTIEECCNYLWRK